MKIVLATRNAGKIAEMRELMANLPVELLAASGFEHAPVVEEDAPEIEGNALKKAHALYDHTGLPALADDTGLEVDVLDGRPGVHSARYAGPDCSAADNRALLLKELEGVQNRAARFRTVMAFVGWGQQQLFEGVCNGHILEEERGTGGFGYDALFVPGGHMQTFAEISTQKKNAISHRGKALRLYVAWLHQQCSI